MGESIVDRRGEVCGAEGSTSMGGFVVRYCGHTCRSRYAIDVGDICPCCLLYIPVFYLQSSCDLVGPVGKS